MAYINIAEQRSGLFVNPFAGLDAPVRAAVAAQPAELSAREWSIVRMARQDRLSSIREESRLGRFVRKVLGLRRQNPLSDSRLEALRRMAVMSWHYGYNVATSEVAEFLAAGFSERQYETLLTRIRAESQIFRGRTA